jgi:hypothetical protein
VAAVVTVVSLAACAGGADPAAMANARAQGELIGVSAAGATSAPSPGGPSSEYSMESGWVDTTGCPSAVFDGVSAGFGSSGTVSRTTPSTSSGPSSVPTLTSKFVPSCAFSFAGNGGITGSGEIFIGMGQSYDTRFAGALVSAGFVLLKTSGYTTEYQRGGSVVGLLYIPENTQGDPYSIVAVIGTNT